MKHCLTLLTFLFLSFQTPIFSQLPAGAIAPDWTLTDIDGNIHTLYDYLDQGKMVMVEFSATWCAPCWNYMQSGALEELWDEHGPDGADDVMAFYIESDPATGMDDLLGQTPGSQGNWVEAVPFPIIDLQTTEVRGQYQVLYYPTLYAVCSDHTIYELGQVSGDEWGEFVQSCTMQASEGTIVPAICAGEGSAEVEVTGGFTPYDYEWSNGENSATIEGLIAGTYTVTVTEANGKISTLEVTVPGATEPLVVSDFEVEEPLCNGSSNGSISISVDGGTPGYEYDWSNGSSNQDLTNVPSDNYSVTVTDDLGCVSEHDFFLDEPDEIEVEGETTPENCDQGDGTISLSISGGVGGYEISSSEGTVFGDLIVDLPAGNVTVEVEDANGCGWTDVFTIEYLGTPELDMTEGAQLTCTQLTTTVSGYPDGGSGEFNYQWTTADGHIVSNPALATITVDAPGTYLLEITDVFSGCETSNTALVVSNIIIPVVDAGASSPINCENLQFDLAGSGDITNVISWTTPNGSIVEGGNTYTPLINAAGTYFINVTNPATNCTSQDSVIIPNESNPASAGFQYLTSGLTMNGTDASSGSNLSGWNWTFGDGNSSSDVNVVHTYAAAGTYEVCHSVQNGCGTSQTCQQIIVTSSGSVLSVDAIVTNVLCHDGTTGSIILTVNGGSGNYTYLWTGQDTTYNTPSIEDIPAGSYQLIITDDEGNSFIGGYTVEQPSAIVIEGSTVVDNSCFGETNGSITINITGGVAPYLYSWNGSPAQPENTLSQLPGGIINAVVTDANGCVLLAGPYTINEPDQLNPGTLVANVLCHGDANGTAALHVSGGVAPYSYLWSNGSQEPNLSGLAAGTYSNTITDANGCQIVVDAVVGSPDVLQTESANVTNASGPDQANGSIELVITGGTGPYQVAWSNGASGTLITGLIPGQYTYVITDANGCQYTSPAPVIVHFSTGIGEVIWPEYVTVTPNPSKGNVVIKWTELPIQNSSLSLMTMEGQLIDSRIMTANEGQWDLTSIGLSNGMYIVMLKQDKQVYPFKLIILE